MLNPIGRYSNFKKKPDKLDYSLNKIQHSKLYVKELEVYVFPTDEESCDELKIKVIVSDLSERIMKYREALSMNKKDPIVILFSSLPLREIYLIAKSFATNPVTFLQTPIDSCPPLDQQLFEEILIKLSTFYHPFLSFLYSVSSRDFILYFSIPLPFKFRFKKGNKIIEKSNKKEGLFDEDVKNCMPLLYLNNRREELMKLSNFYPKADRPIIITNSFPERVTNGFLSCSNLECEINQANPKVVYVLFFLYGSLSLIQFQEMFALS
jgi:hypothetical protein